MRSVLITGGTGSLGHELARQLLASTNDPIRIVVYSRDEQNQEAMRHHFNDHPVLRFFLGDVRDADRLTMALRGIDTVIHAAALKIVPKCEYDPEECVKTNVVGTMNIINACIAAGVRRAILTSTDKAVNPINLYGATKLTAEKLFVAANHLSGSPGGQGCAFSVVRYGNVVNSRGSVIPLWNGLAEDGKPLPITHPDMTRFWITLDQAGDFLLSMLDCMRGGEIFVPRLPAFRLIDLASCIATVGTEIVGIRPGEKIHETLIASDEIRVAKLEGDLFTIVPSWVELPPQCDLFKIYPEGYASYDAPPLTVDELRARMA
jgi:UDP-N-acetylglucosamine 4,6-dehydratase/5-epimerase